MQQAETINTFYISYKLLFHERDIITTGIPGIQQKIYTKINMQRMNEIDIVFKTEK